MGNLLPTIHQNSLKFPSIKFPEIPKIDSQILGFDFNRQNSNSVVAQDYLTSKENVRLDAKTIEALECHPTQTGSPCIVYTSMPQLPDNFVFLNYPTDKYFILDPHLQFTDLYASPDGKTITFTLTTQAVAPFVFLNLRDYTHGHFSDNGFVMVEAEKRLTYYSNEALTVGEFASQLDVTSLFDVTPFAIDYDHKADDDDDDNSAGTIEVVAFPLLVLVSISLVNWLQQ